jgi:hypothetical protein
MTLSRHRVCQFFVFRTECKIPRSVWLDCCRNSFQFRFRPRRSSKSIYLPFTSAHSAVTILQLVYLFQRVMLETNSTNRLLVNVKIDVQAQSAFCSHHSTSRRRICRQNSSCIKYIQIFGYSAVAVIVSVIMKYASLDSMKIYQTNSSGFTECSWDCVRGKGVLDCHKFLKFLLGWYFRY